MSIVVNVYIVLSFFIYIISCSIIFMIIKDMYTNNLNKRKEILKKDFGMEIVNHLENIKNNKKINNKKIEFMRLKLGKKIYMLVLDEIIIEFNKNKENYFASKLYCENFEDIILSKLKKTNKKDDVSKNYFAVMLGEYQLYNYEISEFLFECLNSNSIYLRSCALRSISKIGNIKLLIKSIKYISSENKYIDNKVLVDILKSYRGNKTELNEYLIKNIQLFNEKVQKVIVDYFRICNIEDVSYDLLKILKDDSSNKETKLSIIKYFSVVKYDESKLEIIKALKDKGWEYRAVASLALKNYRDNESKDILVKSISDKNWYVRYNSAISLISFDDNDLIHEVFSKKDKYSKDILIYALFIENKLTYDQYIENLDKIEVGSVC